MPLNPVSPVTKLMYLFANFTWNPFGGRCFYACDYCYVRKGRLGALKKYKGDPYLVESELQTNLGRGNMIFVCSMIDICDPRITNPDISRVLEHCWQYDNWYFFQSKRPVGFREWSPETPMDTVFATTIETNRDLSEISRAPSTMDRATGLRYCLGPKLANVEPVMDFDLDKMLELLKITCASDISFGADSQRCGLPEPEPAKLRELISEVVLYRRVYLKANLGRILGDDMKVGWQGKEPRWAYKKPVEVESQGWFEGMKGNN